MTPARSAFRRLAALQMAAVLLVVPLLADQLLPEGNEPLKGAPAAPANEPAPVADTPVQQPAKAQTPPEAPPSQAAKAATPEPEAKPVPPAPDFSAFIAALEAAERANENLAVRLAQMEAAAAQQRDRDHLFMRDMIKGVLLLAAGMATVGLLALVAIVFLQTRAAKLQAQTFAAQWQALAAHVALPPPSSTPVAAIQAAQSQFEATAHRLEQKLGDLEAMAAGLPSSNTEAHAEPVPHIDINPRTAHGEHAAARPTASSRTPRAGGPPDLLAKASALLLQQQPEVALAYIEQALSENPRNLQAHLKKGAALERLNRLNEAILAYDQAIEIDSSLAVAFLAKAGVLNKMQRYGDALKCYEKALAQQGASGKSESSAA